MAADTPPFFSEDRHRVVPNECVYGMIEVKSRLDTAELHDACQNIARVRALPKTAYYPTRPPFTYRVEAYGRTWSYWPTAGIIFAFDSVNLDLLAARLMDWCRGRDPIEWPDSVWVLGKGCLLWKPLGTKPSTMRLHRSLDSWHWHLCQEAMSSCQCSLTFTHYSLGLACRRSG